jgi:hypothetical protein
MATAGSWFASEGIRTLSLAFGKKAMIDEQRPNLTRSLVEAGDAKGILMAL